MSKVCLENHFCFQLLSFIFKDLEIMYLIEIIETSKDLEAAVVEVQMVHQEESKMVVLVLTENRFQND